MFDAKSLLEALVNGPRQHGPGASHAGSQGDPFGGLFGGGAGSGQPGAAGGLGDLLRNMIPAGPQAGAQPGGSGTSGPQGDPLSELLGRLGGAMQGGGQGGGQSGAGGLGDLLGKLQQQGGQGAGNIVDVLGQVLGKATSGVKEGAGRINETTGAGDALSDAMRNLSGKSPDELMAALKDLIGKNQLGAGAALGGLGALILGTQTGRSLTVNAAKLGALTLIAGLAYKAYQDYQAGRSPASASTDVAAPPAGSGFEPAAVSNEQAQRIIRVMIAAAAADGRIDETEQDRILANLKMGGLDGGAEEFLAAELNAPASVEAIAAGVGTREEAIQLYTAARFAIEPDTAGERDFLGRLASRLGIERELAGHIDAAARNASS